MGENYFHNFRTCTAVLIIRTHVYTIGSRNIGINVRVLSVGSRVGFGQWPGLTKTESHDCVHTSKSVYIWWFIANFSERHPRKSRSEVANHLPSYSHAGNCRIQNDCPSNCFRLRLIFIKTLLNRVRYIFIYNQLYETMLLNQISG